LTITATIEHHPLVERCKQGDMRSFEALYHQYSKAMYSTCYRLLNHSGDAEDILQEAFADAFKNIHRFEYRSSFGTWLKQIVIHKCVSHLRAKKWQWVEIEENSIHHSSNSTDVSEEADMAFKVENIKMAIQALPAGYRTVLSLYLLEGYDHDEIAAIMEVAPSTTRTQYIRAKNKLLQILKEGGAA
jgi:RNA polymerase sigma-70 factor (ECF subfamily)